MNHLRDNICLSIHQHNFVEWPKTLDNGFLAFQIGMTLSLPLWMEQAHSEMKTNCWNSLLLLTLDLDLRFVVFQLLCLSSMPQISKVKLLIFCLKPKIRFVLNFFLKLLKFPFLSTFADSARVSTLLLSLFPFFALSEVGFDPWERWFPHRAMKNLTFSFTWTKYSRCCCCRSPKMTHLRLRLFETSRLKNLEFLFCFSFFIKYYIFCYFFKIK